MRTYPFCPIEPEARDLAPTAALQLVANSRIAIHRGVNGVNLLGVLKVQLQSDRPVLALVSPAHVNLILWLPSDLSAKRADIAHEGSLILRAHNIE